MVSGGTPRPGALVAAQFLRVESHRPEVRGGARHLQGLGELELELGSDGQGVLLASLLLASARLEFRQSRRAPGGQAGDALLAEPRRGRYAARRGAVPLRARRDELREPPRDASRAEGAAVRARQALHGSHFPRRSEPVAAGRTALLRRRRRMSHGVPFPSHAADVHGDPPRGPDADRRHPRADAADPGELPMGDVPAQPRRADARDGDRTTNATTCTRNTPPIRRRA